MSYLAEIEMICHDGTAKRSRVNDTVSRVGRVINTFLLNSAFGSRDLQSTA